MWGTSGVGVRFGSRVALSDVSIDAHPGAVTAVVGGDGAGKTTLLRTLVGAIEPDTGVVERPGVHQIGYMPATSGTYPDLSVNENLEFAAAAYGVQPADAERRVSDYLARTGLTAARDRLVGQLSGGMRQKLGVIQAMVHKPALLVLDEPTTGVDPVSRVDLWWLIARAARDGAAVVLTTSYLDEAERASTLVVLDGGQVLAAGSPTEIAASSSGRLRVARERPTGAAADRAWRRNANWIVWEPEDAPAPDGVADGATFEFQDVVIGVALAHSREAVRRSA